MMEILKDLHYDSPGGILTNHCRSELPENKLRKTTLHLYLPKISRQSGKRESLDADRDRLGTLSDVTHATTLTKSIVGNNERRRSKGNFKKENNRLQFHDSVKPPLVVFVHGGGWRRGHTENWRYFLSRFDTNLFMALYAKYYGHYGNVGESFAVNGLACAVVSYPLLKPPIGIMLIESITSFLMSWFLFLVPFLPLFLVTWAIPWTIGKIIVSQHYSVQHHFSMYFAVLLSLLMSQAVTKLLVILNISNYNFNDKKFPEKLILFSHAFLLMYLSYHLTCTVTATSKLWKLVILDTVCTQSLIIGVQIWNRRTGNSNDFASSVTDQVTNVAKAVRHLTDMAERTNLFSVKDIILCGHSAGGTIVSLLGLDESYFVSTGVRHTSIKGIISVCGIYDISSMRLSLFTNFFYLVPVFGENVNDWRNLSPIHHIKDKSRWKCPFLIASSHWEPVLRIDSDQFEAALQSSGYSCSKIELTKQNHFSILNSFSRQNGRSFLEKACLDFIEKLPR